MELITTPPIALAVQAKTLERMGTPCNNVKDNSVVAYSYYAASTIPYTIYYKVTPYVPIGTGYTYRTASGDSTIAAAVTEAQAYNFTTYPNPATDHIIISNPYADANYVIVDMTGKTVWENTIGIGETNVDLREAAPGSYLVSLYKGGKVCVTKTIVKQ
jgi:hypothetical protein